MGRKAGVVILTLFLGLIIGLAGSGEQGGLPELHLQKLVLEPPSPVVRGEGVQVHAWVMNTGGRPAGEFKVEFFYRPQGGESWASFHVVFISNLAPSRQEALEVKDDGQAIIFDTADLELGTYEIRVVADSNDQIPEEDETNNELVTTLTVLPSRLGLPDLQPVTLAIDPPSPTSGQLVVVSTEIANSGDRDAGPFRISFLVDDQEFDSANLEGLAAGKTTAAQGALDPYALGLGPGSHTLLVVVDAEGQIEEQDEANNELAAALTIQGAELHPASLELDRPLVRLDSRATVSSKVVNTGKGAADKVEVGFYIDGMQFALAELGPLGPGEEATAQGELIPAKPELSLAPGTHELRVVVDPSNLVPELDEANNELVKSLTVLPPEPKLPELHPESLALNPPSPVELGTAAAVTVSSVIANTGRASAEGFSVEFSYRAKGTLRWAPLPCRDRLSCQGLELAPGAELKVEGSLSTGVAAPGIYEIRVVVDPGGGVTELDETNNELSTALTLLSPRLADLAFDPTLPLEVAPAYQVNRGQTLRFTTHLMNMGDLDAGPFEVEFAYCRLPETTPQGTQEQPCTQPTDFITFSVSSLAGLEVGKGVQAQAILETTSLQPGSYLIRVAVDPIAADRPAGRVAEQSEANNLLDVNVLIQGADLIPVDLQLGPPSPVVQGETVEVTATVVNQGVEPTGKFDVNFYWCRMMSETNCTREGEFHSIGGVSFPGIAVNNPEEATVEWDTGQLELGGGTYLIRVVVDPPTAERPQGQVPEQSELNNELISQEIQLIAKPDLLPLALELRPAHEVVQGERVTAMAKLTNSGYKDAPELKVGFYYRSLGAESWVPFKFVTLAGLGIGEQATATAELETEKLDPGDYELKAVVDPEEAIAELSKANNEISTELQIEPKPADLLVQPPLLFEPTPPVPSSQPVKIHATIANEGGSPADEFRVAFLYRKVEEGGGQELVEFDSAVISGLEPGAETTALAVLDTSALAGGTYEICVLADADNLVSELDEGNNRYCTPPPFVLISPPPDLQPKPQLTFDPMPPVKAGQSVKVYVTVTNTGGSPAGKFRVAFLIDGQEFDSAVIPGLETDKEARILGVLDTTVLEGGSHQICVDVDPDDFIEESDEANNRYCTPLPFIVIPALPDLQPKPQLTFDPVPPVETGQSVKVHATVTNIGGSPAGKFRVAFLVDDREFDSAVVSGLEPGEEAEVTGVLDTTMLKGGAYRICVEVDPGNFIPELDETNNRYCTPLPFIVIPALPDLQPKPQLTFDPVPPVETGQSVKVHAEVLNSGGTPVGKFRVAFLYRQVEEGVEHEYVQFDSAIVPGLAPEEQREVVGVLDTSGLAGGAYEICVVADPDDFIEELDEANNSYCTSPPFVVIGQAGQADLLPTNLAIKPSPILRRGQTAHVSATIANRGEGPAGPFVVQFLYQYQPRTGGDPETVQFAAREISKLGPGETITLQVNLDTTGFAYGDYTISVVVDPDNRVRETDEENNRMQMTMTII